MTELANVQFLSVVSNSFQNCYINQLSHQQRKEFVSSCQQLLFSVFFSFPFKNSGCVVLSKGPIEVSCEDWMKNRKVSHTQFKRK